MASVLRAASSCDGLICCIGGISLVPGLIEKVVNRVAFMPPRPPGYHITEENQVYLIEADYGITEMPDLSSEGIRVTAARMHTRRDNDIYGLHFIREGATRTLLFSHGNSTDIGIMFHKLVELCVKLNMHVFAYEYSGYGMSTGLPSEADLYSDIDAAFRYLTIECQVPEENIVAYGQSIGSCPTVDLAEKATLGGLVLHSALKSGLGVIRDVKANYGFDVLQNVVKIGRVRAPVFVFHGTKDTFVPFEHGVALYEACPAELAFEPWWVKEAGHNDIEISHKELYFERLRTFLVALDDEPRKWRRKSREAEEIEY
jgi:pimeloyl-ACP methyl ester carboxylesterase